MWVKNSVEEGERCFSDLRDGVAEVHVDDAVEHEVHRKVDHVQNVEHVLQENSTDRSDVTGSDGAVRGSKLRVEKTADSTLLRQVGFISLQHCVGCVEHGVCLH